MQRSVCKKLLEETGSYRAVWEGLHRITLKNYNNEIAVLDEYSASRLLCPVQYTGHALRSWSWEGVCECALRSAGLEPEAPVTPWIGRPGREQFGLADDRAAFGTWDMKSSVIYPCAYMGTEYVTRCHVPSYVSLISKYRKRIRPWPTCISAFIYRK